MASAYPVPLEESDLGGGRAMPWAGRGPDSTYKDVVLNAEEKYS